MLQKHCTVSLTHAYIQQRDAEVSVLLLLLPSPSSPLLLLMVMANSLLKIGNVVPSPQVECVVTDVCRNDGGS
jgi:hypothetical protein